MGEDRASHAACDLREDQGEATALLLQQPCDAGVELRAADRAEEGDEDDQNRPGCDAVGEEGEGVIPS